MTVRDVQTSPGFGTLGRPLPRHAAVGP
jgi:hypothetical protein